MMQPSRKPRVVLTYGTFDLFHHGHVNLLRRLADLGTELIVGCSTDAFNQIKGKQCVMSYEQRRTILENLPLRGPGNSGGYLGTEALRHRQLQRFHLRHG